MNSKPYLLISKGKPLDGHERNDVAQALISHFELTAERAEALLLSGSPRKIKSFASQAKADELADRLTSLGLDCYVKSIIERPKTDQTTVAVAPEETATGATLSQDRTAPTSKRRPWLLACIIALALIAVAGFAAYRWLTPTTPSNIGKLEEALYQTQTPSMFAYFDAKQSRKLLSLGGEPSSTENSPMQWFESSPLASQLLPNTEYALASINIDGNESTGSITSTPNMAWLVVLDGKYQVADITTGLAKTHDVEQLPNDVIRLVGTNKLVDGSLCPIPAEERVAAKPLYALLSDTQITLASSPELLTSLQEQQSKDTRSDTDVLQRWQQYRSGTLSALQMFDEGLLNTNFLVAMAKNELFGDAKIDALGIKVSPSLLSAGINVNLDVLSADSNQLSQASALIRETLQEKLDGANDNAASMKQLLSRISVNNENGLSVIAKIDGDLVPELQEIGSDFFSTSLNLDPENGKQQEQLVEHPWDYANNAQFLVQNELETNSFSSFKPIYSTSNLNIYLGSIGLLPRSQFSSSGQQEEVFQIKLKAKRGAPKIQNASGWNESGIKQQFMITSVLDRQGKELLSDERCNENISSFDVRNDQISDDTSYFSNALDSAKVARLIDGTDINDIAKLTGWVNLRVPTKVRKETLSMSGKRTANWKSSSLQLQKMIDGDAVYTINGDDSDLVAVRGLNAKGEILSKSSAMSSRSTKSQLFNGELDSLEVIIAEQWQDQRTDFELNSLTVPAQADNRFNSNTEVNVPLFDPTDNAKFSQLIDLSSLDEDSLQSLQRSLNWKDLSLDGSKDKDIGRTSTASTHLIFGHKPSDWFNQLDVVMLLPLEKTVIAQPNSLSLELSVNGGEAITTTPNISVNTSNGEAIADFKNDALDYIDSSFKVELPKDLKKITSIVGKLIYSLPTKVDTQRMELASGNPAIKFKAQVYESIPEALFVLQEARPNLYLVKAIDHSGKQYSGTSKLDDKGRTVLSFSDVTHTNIKAIELYTGSETHNFEESFELLTGNQ